MWVVAFLSEVLLRQKDLMLGENKRNVYSYNLLNFPITGPRAQGCMTSLMGTDTLLLFVSCGYPSPPLFFKQLQIPSSIERICMCWVCEESVFT